MLIFVTYFCGNIATNGLAFYWDRFDVFHPEMQKVLNMGLRIILGCFGSLAIFWIMKEIVCRLPALKWLGPLGVETLGIYFLQGWLIKNCVIPFVGLHVNAFILLGASCSVFLTAFCVIKILKSNGSIRRLVFGFKF